MHLLYSTEKKNALSENISQKGIIYYFVSSLDPKISTYLSCVVKIFIIATGCRNLLKLYKNLL